MKTPHPILALVSLLCLCSACGKKEGTGSPSGSADQSSDAVDVAALNKAGDEELADKGTFAEAREWFKNPAHALFKGDRRSVTQFVDEFYAAGAVNVYVTDIETLGGTDITASLLLVLPKDSAARAKVFEVAGRFDATIDSDPEKDAGQKYLSFDMD